MAPKVVPKFALTATIVLLMAGLWFVLHQEQGYACECFPQPGSPSEELASSTAVFMGQVVSVRTFQRHERVWAGDDATIIEFNVKSVWKGPVYHTVYLETVRSSISCGYPFVEGVEYVVYSEDGSHVSLCSRTRPLSDAAQDLAELGEGIVPDEGTTGPTPDVSAYYTGVDYGQEPAQGITGSTPDMSDRSTGGGCGLSSHSADLSVAGFMVGIAWLGLRKRRT